MQHDSLCPEQDSTQGIGKIPPERVFTRKTPEVSHFRIFGSLAYRHIPEEKIKKLYQTTEKGYLVGYSENAKAYSVYLPGSRKVTVRRDVKFMEDRAFRKSREMHSEEKSKDYPLVQPLQPAKTSTNNSPKGKASEREESQEEEELIDVPTTNGRTSLELRQILRDVEDFIGAPRNDKRKQTQPDRYQALVAQVGEPSSFQKIVQHQVWVDVMVEEYNSIMVNDV